MASFNEHKAALKRLRAAGKGAYVVMTEDAARAGLSTRYPIGVITSFADPIVVGVRKLGQSSVTTYAAGFWRPAPNRLIAFLKAEGRA